MAAPANKARALDAETGSTSGAETGIAGAAKATLAILEKMSTKPNARLANRRNERNT
jgi:hypothetical protein